MRKLEKSQAAILERAAMVPSAVSAFRPKRAVSLAFLVAASLVCILHQCFAEISLRIEIANRTAVNGDCSFSVTAAPPGKISTAEMRKDLRFDLPGFSDVRVSASGVEGRIVVMARVVRAGFYPFQVTMQRAGKNYSAIDYFIAELASGSPTFSHVGYYVFLGRGDYWDPTHQLALWSLRNWEAFADWMALHHADTLFVLLNGDTLAYPSDKYPALRDNFSDNARYNFLRVFIDYAHSRGIRVYLTLTTDDHAEGFGSLYPETLRLNRFGYAANHRALTLEDPKVRQYIVDMVQETLRLYGNADGFVFHPSEADPDRFNEVTKAAFLRETGKDLASTDKAERYLWYNQKFAELLRSLFDIANAQNPHFEFIMFNTWWQDDYSKVYRAMLPASFKVCVWYYDENEEKTFVKWPIWTWVENFGADRVLYMPSGEAFLYPQEPQQQVERDIRVDRLVSAAEALGVKSCIYFAGWDLGSDEDRRRDLSIAQFPTSSFVADAEKKLELLPDLYTDYFKARESVLK